MFSGEAILLAVYFRFLREPKNEITPVWFIIPASLDFFGSFLNFIGIIYLNASAYQILKTLSMVFVITLSKVFLRKQYSTLQYLSVIAVIVGLVVVSSDELEGNGVQVVGVACMLTGQFFHGAMEVVEEYILTKIGSTPALYLIGW